jgi:hypothetical protein
VALRLASIRRIHAVGWGLASESVAELALARLLTLLPARTYLRNPRSSVHPVVVVSEEALNRARALGTLVETIAPHLPFRTRCLQQAIAVQRMLARRALPGTLCLGVSTRHEDRQFPRLGRAAHAWVCVGERIVCGDGDLDRYAVVARLPAA